MAAECGHYWYPVAHGGGETIRSCVFCGEMSFPEAIDISGRVDTRRWVGLGFHSERDELLERLRMRWEDGQDPGIPEKLQRLL